MKNVSSKTVIINNHFPRLRDPRDLGTTMCMSACVADSLFNPSLRGKRSRTSEELFSHSGRAKIGARAKRSTERGGCGERRERLQANPTILKNPFAHERGL